jgi:hypothetical protein
MDIIAAYNDLTEAIVLATGMSRPLLHVHVGMAIYVLVRLAIRERRASLYALGIVLALELANETMNALYYGSWRIEDTTADIFATLFWPSADYLVGTFRRARWTQDRAREKRLRLRMEAEIKARLGAGSAASPWGNSVPAPTGGAATTAG